MSNVPSSAASPRSTRSRGRAALVLALRLGVLALSIEGSAWIGLLVLKGSESFADLSARRAALARGGFEDPDLNAIGLQAATATVVHPFMGFVTNFDLLPHWPVAEVGHPISVFGFIDKNHPLQKRAPDRLVVLVLGGSVAGGMGILGEEEFRKGFAADPRFVGRELVLVRMALGGFKQPQQLMALIYHMALGGEFDIVVNIDGFNELALGLENAKLGTTPIFPRQWPQAVAKVADLSHQRDLGRLAVVKEDRAELARSAEASPLSFSGCHRLFWLIRDQRLQADLASAQQRIQSYRPESMDYEARGLVQGDGKVDDATILDLLAVHWRESSQLLHDLCKARGIRYFHALQPNQYVPDSKPLSAEELASAYAKGSPYAEAVERGYPLLVREAEILKQRGIAFVDLRYVFRDVRDTLYNDTCCHFNRLGNEIATAALVRAILAAY